MKIRNISANQIVVWSAMLLGLVVSVMIGSAVGSSDMRIVAGIIAAIPVAVVFAKLKTNIWLLIPLAWYLPGRLPWLPIPFTVRDLCQITAIFFFTLFFATRVLPWKRKLSALDYLIYINLAYLATVYFRNPAGFWAIQTSVVGGRPYFEILLAMGAFVILSRVNITDSIAKVFPLLFVIPAWSVGALDVISRLFPQTAYPLAMFYSGVGSLSATDTFQQEARIGETRMTGLQNAGLASVLALCAKYNPITMLLPLHPLRAALFGAALAAIFLSGYRSTLLFAFAAFLLSGILRGNFKDVGLVLLVGATVLFGMVSLQGNVVQLPLTMQRALSWLPGDWNEEVIADAEYSSTWRFEMWEWAWHDERILRDKIWGTGFGLSLDDMNLIASMLMSGQTGSNLLGGSDREQFMITGTFHSGPLSTIKYIGAVGLSLYYLLMIYMAVLAWRLCKRARGTKAFPLVLFVAIPIIYEPFNFLVVFGALEGSYPQTLFWAGLLNMAHRYTDGFLSARVGKRAPAKHEVNIPKAIP